MRGDAMKKLLLILLIMVLVVGCGTQPAEESTNGESTDMEMQEFTLEEIEQYNGENGMAYIVIDGDVYDVTEVPQWEGGMHQGFTAGDDFSEEILDAPHGKSVLDNLKKVGTIKE
jgi:predicted heme/steroid binding protein